MSKITIVHGDDWEGIYADGKLVTEGHSIPVFVGIKTAIEFSATSVESYWADLNWLNDEGNLPQNLSDVKFQGDTRSPQETE